MDSIKNEMRCGPPNKRLLSSFIFWLGASFFLSANAQENVVHTGEYITIKPSTDLYILGSYESRNTVTLPIINQGVFHLQGSLIHNGTMNMFGTTPNQGTLRFYGSPLTNATITGSSQINLKHFTIDLDQNITGGGNVLLQRSDISAFGNVSFLNGGFEIDTNTFTLYHDPSNISSGIISEDVEARPYQSSMNIIGNIQLLNYPFSSGSTYNNLKGMGISFTQVDPLGGTPYLYRRFDTLSCGDIYNSILRSFIIEGNTNPAQFSDAKIKFLNAPELGLNPNGTNLRVFVSEDMGQVWRPKINNTGDADSVTSTGGARFMQNPNYTILTAATPCNSIVPIEVHQIITNVTPNDTLFNITEALVCDPTNISARVYATADAGSYIEWRESTTSAYISQSPQGYYEATQFGTYWVRITSIRGCIDSMSIDVVPTTPADTDFTPSPSSVCLGSAVNLTPTAAMVAGSTYLWTFGDGDSTTAYSTSHTYAAIGTYTVTLKVTTSMGCSYSENTNVVVKDIPVAAFIPGAACPGQTVSFDNNSSVQGFLGLIDLTWDFGDATNTTSQGNSSGSGGTGDVSHIYASEGTYAVTLTASANGCTSIPVVQNVTVYPVPQTSFNVTNACEGQSVNFNNTTTISDSSPMTYLWDFTGGGGPTSNTVNPVYAYPASGNYTVNLTATSSQGCVSMISQPITIHENPVAAFNATNACVNNPATFADVTPVITGSTPYTYAWDFGDSNTGTAQNETNSYTAAGTYTVTLIVTTSNGCVGSTSQSVTIYPGPNLSFTAANACSNSPVAFTNTSTNTTSYMWNFPSLSVTTSQQNTTQTFTTDGTFPVILSGTSSNGCQDTITGSITIYPLPVVNLGGSVATCGTTYVLDANPGGINNGCTFLWGTGDVTPQYTATYDDDFDVTVTSGLGCVSSDVVTVTLNANVLPALGPDASFCDSTVLDAGYPGSTFSWSTGATTQTISVTASGNYSVTVTDQNGCVGSDAVVITIVPGTPVNLGPDQVSCMDVPVVLNAGAAASYLWSDGSTSSTLTVPSTGYYWVQNTNGGGCSSSDTVFVTYNTIPNVTLGNDQIVCDQTVLNGFTANSSYLWNTSATTPSITITSSGTYILTVTNLTTGCDNSDTVNVTVNPLPIVNLGNDFSVCSYASGTIDAGNPGATYVWNSGPTTQQITVSASGNYMVTVTDGNGCSASDNITVTMLPLFSIELGPDKQFCEGSTIILDAGLTTTGNTYLWEDENGVLATTTTYQVADTGMHYLTVTDANNCVASDSVNITPSNISLHAFYLADSDIIGGETVRFVNLSYPHPYTSQWFVDNVFVTNDSMPTITFSPPVTPPSDTVYVKLKVDNTFCISEITKPIVVNTSFSPPPSGEGTPGQNNGLYSSIRNSLLYPNPNNGNFNFLIELTQEAPIELNVFNVAGALIHSEKKTVSTTVIPFDFKGLSTGIYFLQVRIYNETKTHKFIILPY